jgi:cytochrome c biogenesis protein CcmG/thiol:disulfide interchange protein DsbE
VTIKNIFILTTVLAVSVLLSSCRNRDDKIVLREGDPAPLFSLNDSNGKIWSLEELKGKVVLVNFWASWCPSCKEEKPSLQKLSNMTSDKPDFLILTILYNDAPSGAFQFMKKNNLNLPLLLDEKMEVSSIYGVTGVPETYIIDKKSVLRRKIIGPTRFDTPDSLRFISGLILE